jgi:hypothetical protein
MFAGADVKNVLPISNSIRYYIQMYTYIYSIDIEKDIKSHGPIEILTI